jgi:hypothetical protein
VFAGLEEGQAVIQQSDLPDFLKAEAALLVFEAASTFLPQDTGRIISVEQAWTKTLDGFNHVGITDLVLSSSLVIDWKTFGGDAKEWESRMRDSWQWRLYGYALGASRFEYRGLPRLSVSWIRDSKQNLIPTAEAGVKLKVVAFEIDPEENNPKVERYLRGLNLMRDALRPFPIWPQKMPGSCNAYGRLCPYYADCRGKGDMKPRLVSELPDLDPRGNPHLSHSGAEEFLLCPERYRRGRFEPKDETPESLFGTTVHAALAAIYLKNCKENHEAKVISD